MTSGGYRNRYGAQSPQGIGAGPIFAVGAIMLAAGAFVVAHALTGGVRLPPASAQQIPATVTTTVPFAPDPSAVAAPLAPSTPVRIKIPAIGVSAPVMRLGKNGDGTVEVPPLDNHNLAGWYDGSVTPGADGSSVVLGHVDDYDGPSVFFSIKALHRGDTIDIVRADGDTAAFAVDGVQKVGKTEFPTGDVYGSVPYPALRLVTCGGPFDVKRGEYLDNIVVYAHLTGIAAG
ncbi:MAG TPA: class F sortase [Trebonia sp.]|nr:class F sortase [Trebonia sp.]